MDPIRRRSSPLLVAGVAVVATTLLAVDVGLGAGAVAAVGAVFAALRWPTLRPALLALPALLCQAAPALPLLPAPPPGPVQLAGIAADVRDENGGVAFDLCAGRRRLRVHADDGDLRPGDRVVAIGRASLPTLAHGPGAVHVPRGGLHIERPAPSIQALACALRRLLQHQLLSRLPPDEGALLSNLVLNQGPPLPPAVAAAHRATGLAHLLAVSGSHAAVLALLLGLAPGSRLPRHVHRRWRTCALAILGLYGLLTGLEAPVFRAVCAFTLCAVATEHHRRVGLLAALLVPAMLTALWAPLDLHSRGFGLSYAAVFGLSCSRGGGSSALHRWLLLPLRASFWATLCTAPLTLLWFGQLAPWTIVLTPLLAPLCGTLLLGGLLCAVLAIGTPLLGDLLAAALAPLADLYAAAVVAADALPGTPIHAQATPSAAMLTAAAAAAALAIAWRRDRSGIAIACGVLVAVHFLPPRAPSPCFHLFAIGHGQCAMAELADGTTVVIDCGSLQHPFLPPKKVAAALRVRRIDLLVLTHGDRDHVGSVPSLLEQADVGLACVPAEMLGSPPVRLLAAKGAAVRGLRNGEHVAFGAAAVISRPTPAAGPHSDNDSSLWVRLDLSGTSVLVPGDPEDRGIDAAIAAGIAAPSEVLVLPHHGRRNGRTAALLRSVRPQLCCVSNRAGEGGSAQGEIAAGAGLPVLATGERGDLCVRPGPTGCRAEAEFAAPPAAH